MTGSSRQALYAWAYLALPIILPVLVMLPRLLDPQFGLFDDGVTISNARAINEGTWSAGWEAATGRYRPAYWLYYGLIYMVAGASPMAFFLGNTLLLAATTALLMSLVRSVGGTKLHAFITAGLFVLSGPVIENYYTLSKGEPLQLFWILAALRLVAVFPGARSAWKKVLLFLAAVLALFLANASKETSLVVIPVSTAWVFLAWLRLKRELPHPALTARLAFFGSALTAAAVFYLSRALVVPVGLTEGGYTGMYELGFSSILASAFRWMGWLLRGLPYLIPLGVFAFIWVWRRRRVPSALLILETLVWMVAWMGIYLPWIYTVEYYMLPLYAGAALLAGLLFQWALEGYSQPGVGMKVLSGASLVLAVAALVVSQFNNLSNARLQLAVDAANAEMLAFVAASSQEGSRVYVNLPADNEYVYEVELHLSEIWNRHDLQVSRFQFQRAGPGSVQAVSYIVVSPEIENQPLLSVRLGVYEQGTQTWNEALRGFLGRDAQPAFVAERSFRLTSVDFLRLLCPFFSQRNYCSPPYLILDRRPLAYRWNIYQVDSFIEDQVLPAAFSNGVWILQLPDSSVKTIHFGEPGDLPLPGDWMGSGTTGLAVYRESNQTWYFDFDLDGKPDFESQFTGMQPGDIPLVGDWNGDGFDTPAFFRPSSAVWYFSSSMAASPEDILAIQAGQPGDIPLVGDWNGDGQDTIGVYRPETGEVNLEDRLDVQFQGIDFLLPVHVQVVPGDWNGRGVDTLAVVDGGTWTPHVSNCSCTPSNPPQFFDFGSPDAIPSAGFWR